MRFFTSLYAYRLSKVALNMAMRVLAVDVRKHNVLVGIMAPGVVETRLLQQAGYGGGECRLRSASEASSTTSKTSQRRTRPNTA